MMPRLAFAAVPLAVLLAAAAAAGQEADPRQQFLTFVRAQAAQLRAKDAPPATRAEWDAQQANLRHRLLAAWGPAPGNPAPLEPQVLGTLKRDGYRVEKLTFQTLPGVRMTANAYVPDRPGKLPAVLAVHGHWRGARVDPVVQKRCIGLAKLGFFVLAVDAFGAGERGVGTALGEYHGEMTAATLLPAGLPLSGIQVYENYRAVDYLRSRPEVDPARLGITGASGGGNQSMYAGAWDDRFRAVVPVCSVGNYQAYLGAACCMCEVVPGALRFTEEWGVLGLTAPRGLMVVNATQDARQFSVGEAKKSLEKTAPIYKLLDRPAALRHAVFEGPHDYSQPMREAMYGWMTLHLKGEGDGEPIPEKDVKAEDPEAIRCFPGGARPADWMTLPRFAAAEGRKLLAKTAALSDVAEWKKEALVRTIVLRDSVLGGFPAPAEMRRGGVAAGKAGLSPFEPEPGLTLVARHQLNKTGPRAVLLDLDGADKAASSPLARALTEAGWTVVTLDLRATGKLAVPGDAIGRAPDHNSAEWSLWIGRPLLGQWTYDVRRLLDVLTADGKDGREVVVIGRGPAGLVALAAAATDKRVTQAAAVDTLASFVSDVPYQGQRLGVMAPGILRLVGDVQHLAALAAPRRVVIAGGVRGDGTALTAEQQRDAYRFAADVWGVHQAAGELKLLPSADPARVVESLK